MIHYIGSGFKGVSWKHFYLVDQPRYNTSLNENITPPLLLPSITPPSLLPQTDVPDSSVFLHGARPQQTVCSTAGYRACGQQAIPIRLPSFLVVSLMVLKSGYFTLAPTVVVHSEPFLLTWDSNPWSPSAESHARLYPLGRRVGNRYSFILLMVLVKMSHDA